MENDGWWELPKIEIRAIGPLAGGGLTLPFGGPAGVTKSRGYVPLEVRIRSRKRLRLEICPSMETLNDLGEEATVQDLFNHFFSGESRTLSVRGRPVDGNTQDS